MNKNVRLIVYLVITVLISVALFSAKKEVLGILTFLGGVFLNVRAYIATKKYEDNQ